MYLMFLKNLVLVAFTICFTACSEKPLHILAAHKVKRPFVQNAKDQGFGILGSGGSMMKQVEEISVSFIADGELNVEQVRRQFLELVVPFVNEIASSVDLQQYLAQPEYPERAANISITYQDQTHKSPRPPFIAHVMMVKGKIYYAVSDSPNAAYRDVYEETYQEALQKFNCGNHF
jgi:hypothetical protein